MTISEFAVKYPAPTKWYRRKVGAEAWVKCCHFAGRVITHGLTGWYYIKGVNQSFQHLESAMVHIEREIRGV